MATQETTAVEWRRLDLDLDLKESPEVLKYLSRDVVAVQLPEKVSSRETYPWLILDGASGVGKTQQAFAMLKSTDPPLRLVYQLLVPESDTEQPIYKEMRLLNRRFSDRDQMSFLFLVNEAIRETRTRATAGDDPLRDPFSVPFLSNQAKLDFQQDRGLGRLMVRLAKCIIRRASDQTPVNLQLTVLQVLKMLRLASDQTQARDRQDAVLENLKLTVDTNVLENPEATDSMNLQDTVLMYLKDTVLFLDEVLPSKESPEATSAAERLRFLRNFGRALGMRVVMAGTAATAANMIGVANPTTPVASRSGDAEVG
jgi:hypothetical protein